MELLKALDWRYATKRMTSEKLEQSLVDQVIDTARMAPTSAGLQPYKIISISDPETKKAIAPIALNQPQIIECSHLLVFAAWDKIDDERLEAAHERMRKERSQPPEQYQDVIGGLKELFSTFTQEQQYHHTAKQAHIGFGLAIGAAAELRVDATPMEGFDKDQLDKFLRLEEHGLKSVTLLALGRRDVNNDWLLPWKKVRQPREEFVIEIK